MKLIWNKHMFVNTIHVEDLCAAVTHLTKEGAHGEIYNVVDQVLLRKVILCAQIYFTILYYYEMNITISLSQQASGFQELLYHSSTF